MTTKNQLHCSVITPEKQILDADAASVVLPAHDGLLGVLDGRAPLLCQLGTGPLRVETTSEGTREFFVDGGFAQVLDNQVTLLTDRAAPAESLSRADAENELAAAQAMPADNLDAVAARRKAIEAATTKLNLAKK